MKNDAIMVGGIALAILFVVYSLKHAAGAALGSAADAVAGAAQAVGQGVSNAIPYVNPADNKNLIYQGANGVTHAITGDQDASLGTALYDLLNQ